MSNTKPDIIKIIIGASVIIYIRRVALSKALLIPFLMFLAMDVLIFKDIPLFLSLLLLVPNIAIYTILAICTHRIVLLGADSVPIWGLRRWTKRETYFAYHLIKLMLLGFVFAPVMFFWPLGSILGSPILFYLIARLVLVFPASAIDQGLTFRMSWRLSKNHQSLMILITIFAPIFFGIPIYLLNMLPSSLFWLSRIYDTFACVFGVGSLSLAYNEIYTYECKN